MAQLGIRTLVGINGSNVLIYFDVSFVTHDGATWVIREFQQYKDCIKFGKINIEDNVFIGCHTTIFPNVNIGRNSIVAACSLVNKSIPANQVCGGGIPAKFITITEEFAKKYLSNNPDYDINNYQMNFKEEVLRITSNLK